MCGPPFLLRRAMNWLAIAEWAGAIVVWGMAIWIGLLRRQMKRMWKEANQHMDASVGLAVATKVWTDHLRRCSACAVGHPYGVACADGLTAVKEVDTRMERIVELVTEGMTNA